MMRIHVACRIETVADRADLFRQMVEALRMVEPALDVATAVAEIMAREESFPTALGHGVAVPHGYLQQVRTRLCAIAQLQEGLDFDAPDGQPVRLVFLIIGPTNDPNGHLTAMAEVARIVFDEALRTELLNAPDSEELARLVGAKAFV